MLRSGPLLCLMSVPLLIALSGCVPTDLTGAGASKAPSAALVPVEPATTAYISRADGPHIIPAVPLEKLREDMRRQDVVYASTLPPGSIVIHPGQKHLYFITGNGRAIRYGISVGRAGFEWAGEAVVSQTKQWPTWTPPPEMIERDPKLSKWEKGQPGGPTNPLGARAIYLLTNGRDYGYRIHGTPDWWSIGRNASSGCIRMIHQDVIDLNQRVQPGARVLVLNADGSVPAKLKLPPPAPVKKKPKPAEATVSPVVAPVSPLDAATPQTGPALTPAGTTPPATGTVASPPATGSIPPAPIPSESVSPSAAVAAPQPIASQAIPPVPAVQPLGVTSHTTTP